MLSNCAHFCDLLQLSVHHTQILSNFVDSLLNLLLPVFFVCAHIFNQLLKGVFNSFVEIVLSFTFLVLFHVQLVKMFKVSFVLL